MYWDTECN